LTNYLTVWTASYWRRYGVSPWQVIILFWCNQNFYDCLHRKKLHIPTPNPAQSLNVLLSYTYWLSSL